MTSITILKVFILYFPDLHVYLAYVIDLHFTTDWPTI